MVAALLAAQLLGCQGGNSLPMAKVAGTVKLDGAPLTKGNVRFMPDSGKGTQGPMATGQIGSDGKFVLTTSAPGDGAHVGFYKVAVSCWDEPPFDPKNPTAPPPAKSLIPERYGDEKTSELTAEVKRGGPNEFTFDLKSSAAGGAAPRR
jgi:hypothetical protein